MQSSIHVLSGRKRREKRSRVHQSAIPTQKRLPDIMDSTKNDRRGRRRDGTPSRKQYFPSAIQRQTIYMPLMNCVAIPHKDCIDEIHCMHKCICPQMEMRLSDRSPSAEIEIIFTGEEKKTVGTGFMFALLNASPFLSVLAFAFPSS